MTTSGALPLVTFRLAWSSAASTAAGMRFVFFDSTENPGICTSATALPFSAERFTPNATAMNRSATFHGLSPTASTLSG